VGFLDGLLGGRGKTMKDPVRGTGQIVSCSPYGGRGRVQRCELNIVVRADGVTPTAVELQERVHHASWPFPGMTLPVTVDRANPENLTIEWGEGAER